MLVGWSRGEPIAESDVTSFYFVLFNNNIRLCNDTMKAGTRLAFRVACRSCSNRDRQVSDVEVFANARQQNLIEWLKGVRRYELSGCLRQAVVMSNDPGGVQCNMPSG